VLDRVLAVTHAADRGICEADLGVLLPARQGAHTAASLLEIAFLTNPGEAGRLAREDYRQALAQAIADGIASRLSAGPAAAVVQSVSGYAMCAPSALKLSLTRRAQAYAEPLFDTGEHVLTGGDLYPDQLLVGQSPGVLFSYGELISMGDLYETAEDMMKADVTELGRLKKLIDRSTEYYRGGKRDKSLDVGDDEWDAATGGDDTHQGRYLKLAEENYNHFSPNTIFTDSVAQSIWRQTNKPTWEMYHRQAIKAAQEMALDPQNQNVSYVPVYPLIVNAFGDHFLTDAFSSGHLINKELIIAYFKANFFSGDSLNDDADAFFERVADEAWEHPEVSGEFSKLEDTKWARWHGIPLPFHADIDSPGRFKILLTKAAEQEPERIGNFVVKAIHDKLNKDGIEVVNAAGDGPWTLFGDGHLDPTTLAIMRKAVQQSVDNINDPSILASNIDFDTYFDKVWRFVPRLTTASAPIFKQLVREYTDPKSRILSTAAAQLIKDKVKEMTTVLVSEHHLRKA
jgi:hypothetical protein